MIAYFTLYILLILAIIKLLVMGDSLQQSRIEGQDTMVACNEIIKEEH